MNRAFLLVTFSLFAGCAFQKSDLNQESAAVAAPEYRLAVGWSENGQSPTEEASAVVRALSLAGAKYASAEPITLPVKAPEKLYFQGTIQGAHFSGESDVKGSISYGERAVSLPVRLRSAEQRGAKTVLNLEVAGLDAAFKTEKSSTGSLTIRVTNTSGSSIALEALIRTPPSELATEAMTLSEFSTQEQGRDFDFVSPAVLGQQLNLVKVIRLTNNEKAPTEIRTPLTPEGGVAQKVRQYSVAQQECSYTRQVIETFNPVSSRFLMLPLDERFLEQAEAGIRDGKGSIALTTPLKPGTSVLLGLYGVGTEVTHWLKNGPPASTLSNTRAVAGCGTVCSSRICEPTPGAGGGRYGLTGCTCEAYEKTYTHADVTTGAERGAVHLVFNGGANKASVRFGDLSADKDRETRSILIAPETSELTR